MESNNFFEESVIMLTIIVAFVLGCNLGFNLSQGISVTHNSVVEIENRTVVNTQKIVISETPRVINTTRDVFIGIKPSPTYVYQGDIPQFDTNVGMIRAGTYLWTGSMSPLFTRGGRYLYTTEFGKEDIEEGSIIVFRCNGVETLHGVIDIHTGFGNTRYITQGWNNEVVDDCITEFDDIKRLVVGVVF